MRQVAVSTKSRLDAVEGFSGKIVGFVAFIIASNAVKDQSRTKAFEHYNYYYLRGSLSYMWAFTLFLLCNTVATALGSDAKPSYTISVVETPLAVARRNGYSDDVVKLLEEHVDAKFPLHAAAKAGDIDTMTELLDGGAEVDGVANGRTALSIACENGQVDAAKLLLDRGADLGRLTRVASAPEDSASAPNVSPVSP